MELQVQTSYPSVQSQTPIKSVDNSNHQELQNDKSKKCCACCGVEENREKLKLIISTLLAMIDVGTDTNLMVHWFINKKYYYASYQLFWMFITNIFTLSAIVQFKPKYIFIESLLTMCGFGIPLGAIHSWSTTTELKTIEKLAAIQTAESLFEAMTTLAVQILFLMNSSSFEIPVIASVVSSLFSLSFTTIKKSRYIYKVGGDKFDKTYILMICVKIFDYIFRATSFLIFVKHYNQWYHILVSILCIVMLEMILVYYHSKSYASEVEIDAFYPALFKTIIYCSNVIFGVFSTSVFMFFYVILKKRHNAFNINKSVVFMEFYGRWMIAVFMLISVNYTLEAIFDDLWTFISIICGG
eukprot:146367_1